MAKSWKDMNESRREESKARDISRRKARESKWLERDWTQTFEESE
jgi:hypothetical protein